MKELILVPERARGTGNIQKNFSQNTVFDSHHVKATYKELNTKYGIPFRVFKLEAKGEKCYLNLSKDYESIYPHTGVSTITALLKSGETLTMNETVNASIKDDSEWTNLDENYKSYYGSLGGVDCRKIKHNGSAYNDFKWDYVINPEDGYEYSIDIQMFMDKSWDYFSFNFINTSIAYVKTSFDTSNKNKNVYYDNKDPSKGSAGYNGMWICNGEKVLNAQMPVLTWFTLHITIKNGLMTVSYPSQRTSARIYNDFEHTFKELLKEPFQMNFSYWGQTDDNMGVASIRVTKKSYKSSRIDGQIIKVWEDGILLDQQETDSNGEIHFKYSNDKTGKHTLTFNTKFSNGWEATSKDTSLYVYKTPTLTIEPKELHINRGDSGKVVAKLVGENNVALRNEQVVLMEHMMERLPNNTNKVTDNNGEVSYVFKEDSNWGDTTGIYSQFPYEIIQNHLCTITGRLQNTSGSVVYGKQRVQLWMDYQGMPLLTTSTNKNGEFTFKYNPSVSGYHMLYIVFDGVYGKLTPCFSKIIGTTILKSPQITLNSTKSTIFLGESVNFTITVRSLDESDTNFNDKIYIYEQKDNGKKNLLQIGTLVNGVYTLKNWKKSYEGIYKISVEYMGNKIYSGNSTSTSITVTKKSVKLVTDINSFQRTVKETITTRLTDTDDKPIVGETIYWYLGNEKTNTNKIGSGVTDTTGTAKLNYMVDLAEGTSTLYTEHPASKYYTYNIINKKVSITKKRTNILLSNMKDRISSEQSISVKFRLIKFGTSTPISNKNIKIYIDNVLKTTLKTDTNGYITYKITGESLNTGQEATHILKSVFDGDVDYKGITIQQSYTVKALLIPLIELNTKNGICEREDAFIGTVDSDTTNKYFLHMITSKGKDVLIGEMIHEGSMIYYQTNFSKDENTNYTRGHHKYYVKYEGDVNYDDAESEKYDLNLAGKTTIKFNETSINILYGETKKITGLIYNEYTDLYEDNLKLELIDKEIVGTTITEVRTLYNKPISNGNISYNLNSKNLLLKNGTYILRATIRNYANNDTTTSTDYVEETSEIEVKVSTANVPVNQFYVENITLKQGSNLYLSCTVPSDCRGTVYWIDSNGDIIGSALASNFVAKTGFTTKTVISSDKNGKSVKSELSSNGGVHQYYCKLLNDPYYKDSTTEQAQIIVHIPYDFVLNSQSIWADESRTLGINSITDQLGELFEGNMKVVLKGNDLTGKQIINRTITVNCTNGSGSFTIGKDEASYNLQNHRLVVTATCGDCTKTIYVYLLPQTEYAIYIKELDNLTESNLKYYTLGGVNNDNNGVGYTDIYLKCYYENEEWKQVIQTLKQITNNNTTLKNKFRWHLVLNILRDDEGNSYTTNNTINSQRLEVIKQWILDLYNQGSDYFDGIVLDEFEYNTTSDNSVLVTDINNTLDTILEYKKKAEKTNNTSKQIGMFITNDYQNNKNVLRHGHDYTHLRTKIHRLIPKTIMATTFPNDASKGNYWIDQVISNIVSLSGSKRTLALIEGKRIIKNGNNYSLEQIGGGNLNMLVQSTTMWGSNGFILCNTDKSPNSLPTKVLNKSSSDYCRKTFCILGVNGTTYNPVEIINTTSDGSTFHNSLADSSQVIKISKSLFSTKGLVVKVRDYDFDTKYGNGWIKGGDSSGSSQINLKVGQVDTTTSISLKVNGTTPTIPVSRDSTAVIIPMSELGFSVNKQYKLYINWGGTTSTKTLGSSSIFYVQFTD